MMDQRQLLCFDFAAQLSLYNLPKDDKNLYFTFVDVLSEDLLELKLQSLTSLLSSPLVIREVGLVSESSSFTSSIVTFCNLQSTLNLIFQSWHCFHHNHPIRTRRSSIPKKIHIKLGPFLVSMSSSLSFVVGETSGAETLLEQRTTQGRLLRTTMPCCLWQSSQALSTTEGILFNYLIRQCKV